MEEKYVIYRISFNDTKKCYIGMTEDYNTRCKKHICDANRGFKSKLSKAIRKYKNPKFEILEECLTIKELKELEIYYIKFYDSFKNGYNSTLGGEGTFGSPRPKYFEWRKRQSSRMLGENNPNYGKHWDDNWKQNHSNRMKKYYESNPDKKLWKNKFSLGFIWINNGKTSKKIRKSEKIPEGFIKGRGKRSWKIE